ncbi:hypothetical protein LINPERHAP1_LOCUS7588 [Linum perenne]
MIHQIQPLLPRIRSFYHNSDVRLSDGTLAWVMAIDGLFFVELLCDLEILCIGESSSSSPPYFGYYSLQNSPTNTNILGDIFMRIQLAITDRLIEPLTNPLPRHSVLLNDIVLLENQIPVSLVAEALSKFQPDVRKLLAHNLDSVCRILSPVPLQNNNSTEEEYDDDAEIQIIEKVLPSHLLGYLYSKIITAGTSSHLDEAGGADAPTGAQTPASWSSGQ